MDIKIFNSSFENKRINLFKPFVVVFAFIVVILTILILKNDFNDYYIGTGILNKENTILILVDVADINQIIKGNKIIIERTTFSYKINSIDDDVIEYGTSYLKKVYLEVSLPDYLNVVNNNIKYQVLVDKDTIFSYIFKMIKGE